MLARANQMAAWSDILGGLSRLPHLVYAGLCADGQHRYVRHKDVIELQFPTREFLPRPRLVEPGTKAELASAIEELPGPGPALVISDTTSSGRNYTTPGDVTLAALGRRPGFTHMAAELSVLLLAPSPSADPPSVPKRPDGAICGVLVVDDMPS